MAATKKGGTVKKAAKPAPKDQGRGEPLEDREGGLEEGCSKEDQGRGQARQRPEVKPAARASTRAKASSNGKPKTAAKKPAVKLTPKQTELLGKVQAAGEAGFAPSKAEARAIEPLLAKKVVKKGAKNKATGLFSYHVTKVGQKHLSTPSAAPAAPASSSGPAPSATA